MKVSYEEYRKASNEYWRDYVFVEENSEEKDKCLETIMLYQKQNRFNPFKFLDGQYRDHIKYGKLIKNCIKITLTSLVLHLPGMMLIFYNKNFALLYIFTIILSLIPFVIAEIYKLKYEKIKEDYDYQKKYNPNFYREQKLKRVLNGL